jgi:hypothetical protein
MMDAYVLREMHRRCNYDSSMMHRVRDCLIYEMAQRPGYRDAEVDYDTKLGYYIAQWERSGLVSAVIFPYIMEDNAYMLPLELLDKLINLAQRILSHRPFPLITVHDESTLGSAS